VSIKEPKNPVKESKKILSLRVPRGGYWNDSPSSTRASYGSNAPSNRYSGIGFRIARTKK